MEDETNQTVFLIEAFEGWRWIKTEVMLNDI